MHKIILSLLILICIISSTAIADLVDNNDGTVTDTETGLMWQKGTAPGTYTWQQALAYAEELTLAGHSDWRLPNRNELQTLVDYSRYNPAIDPILEVSAVLPFYWSSTSNAYHMGNAWFVYFDDGYVYYDKKSEKYYVRVVRTG